MPISQDDSSNSILLVAAEASSCMYAKKFIEQWCENAHGDDQGAWEFFGIGDREMHHQGMDCQGLAEDLAVVGLQEVLTHWGEIKATYNKILEQVEKRRPQFALLLDYPGFNFWLAAKLKKMNIPVVYYISPQLWAWKKGRVHKVKRDVSDMLVVFPFEVDFYASYGVEAHFVGHPLVEVVEDERSRVQAEKSQSPILGLMPGSRKSEIQFNLQTQLQAARKVVARNPKVCVRLLLAPTLDFSWVKSQVQATFPEVEIVQGKPTQMIAGCDVLLSASGTATLQVALCEKPMVVMYKMKPFTAFFARMLVRSVKFFCIVNLVAEREIVPEFFQKAASADRLGQEVAKIIEDQKYREQMVENLREVTRRLGSGGATKNVVDYLRSKYLGKSCKD